MNRALVIGISDYPAPVSKLPAVAADVREIGKLLASPNGTFRGQVVDVLTNAQATRPRVLKALEAVFRSAGPDDTVFVYVAGHGAAADPGGAYYFVTHDAVPGNVAATAVPLVTVKRLFDECRSRQVLLWLDFCHSGGIIPRRLGKPMGEDDNQAIARELKVVQGDGKLIFAACTPEQYAWEDAALGHGLFTAFLLRGLRGDAASAGEVTAGSLYDYIDRQMGSGRQRPMMFGHMAGRLVLMHAGREPQTQKPKAKGPGAAAQKSPEQKPARAKGVASGGGNRVVDSSGNWCLLGDAFFRTKAVRTDRGGAIAVEIPSGSAGTDAALGRLRPPRFGGPGRIGFAHLNDALLVRVEHVESASAGGQQVWTVALRPEDVHYGGGVMEMAYGSGQRHYSADELARLRAGRILLNDPPPPPQAHHGLDPGGTLESLIQGLGAPMPAKACAIQTVYREHRGDREFLKLARLACILQLKASGVVEEVLRLALGPVRKGSVHVSFRGRRARAASNVGPPVIDVEGDCPLV